MCMLVGAVRYHNQVYSNVASNLTFRREKVLVDFQNRLTGTDSILPADCWDYSHCSLRDYWASKEIDPSGMVR